MKWIFYIKKKFSQDYSKTRKGRSICRWAENEDFQYGISRFWEKYGRETVFSTLGAACNYWEKQQEIGIWNHKKRNFDIWTSFKKIFFASNTSQVFGTLWRLLKSQNVILQYTNTNLFLYYFFLFLIKNIREPSLIWCITKGGWVGFYCFLTNIFQLPSNRFKI